ncbi:hypothetical protein D3C87_508170 [compost metagenome]
MGPPNQIKMKKNFKISLLLISDADIAQQVDKRAAWEQNAYRENNQRLMFLHWIPEGAKANGCRELMNISRALNTIH